LVTFAPRVKGQGSTTDESMAPDDGQDAQTSLKDTLLDTQDTTPSHNGDVVQEPSATLPALSVLLQQSGCRMLLGAFAARNRPRCVECCLSTAAAVKNLRSCQLQLQQGPSPQLVPTAVADAEAALTALAKPVPMEGAPPVDPAPGAVALPAPTFQVETAPTSCMVPSVVEPVPSATFSVAARCLAPSTPTEAGPCGMCGYH
jgi:hypothetical protein